VRRHDGQRGSSAAGRAPGAVISRGPGEPRPARRQPAAIPIVVALAAQADPAAVATVTAGSRGAFLCPAAHGISEFPASP
jgi:hypothetical protein